MTNQDSTPEWIAERQRLEAMIAEHAQAMANQCQAIADNRVAPRGAAVRRIVENASTLAAWIAAVDG